jgi:hypothetical protein
MTAHDFQPDPIASLATLDPWIRLAAGIVLQAGLEAREGDPDARSWLRSDDCALICEGLGLDHRAITARLKQWAGRKPTGRLGRKARRLLDPASQVTGGAIVIQLSFSGG